MIDSHDTKGSPKNQGLFSTKEAAKILIVNNCKTPPFLLQYFLNTEVFVVANGRRLNVLLFKLQKGALFL